MPVCHSLLESFGERGASWSAPGTVSYTPSFPLPSSRSAALATGQGAGTSLLLQRAKVNVVERATQLHGPCVRCGHRVHSGRAQLDCSSGWVAGGHRPKDNTSYTRRKVPLTEAGVERREPAQWDELPELRVWDPGDG